MPSKLVTNKWSVHQTRNDIQYGYLLRAKGIWNEWHKKVVINNDYDYYAQLQKKDYDG